MKQLSILEAIAEAIETWKPIIGLEEYYQISSFGRVKTLSRMVTRGSYTFLWRERIIGGHLGQNGYWYMDLVLNKKKTRWLLHRLLAVHFIPNPENKKEVNHIDSNPGNFNLSNLEWVTASENMKHVVRMGRSNIYEIGKISSRNRMKRVDKLSLDGSILKTFDSVTDAAKDVYSRTGDICAAIRGKQKTCKGYKWQYAA